MTHRTEPPSAGLPRPELSIGHPEFDAFLSAPVGEDGDGVELSVMSALARLGLDPWSEAARLSDLPRDAAAEALALTLAKLPAATRHPADDPRPLADRARRLVDCLPRRHRPVDKPRRPAAAARSRPAPGKVSGKVSGKMSGKMSGKVSGPAIWAVYAAIAVGFYLLFSQVQSERQLEPEPSRTMQR